MRIISGTLKGKKLNTLRGREIRPTSDKIKEAVFNVLKINFEKYNVKVLDLFAGSGNLGIEALSRGAVECTFIEKSRQGYNILKKNIKDCGFEDKARLIKGDVYVNIKKIANNNEKFDLILSDPPYELGHIEKILAMEHFYNIVNYQGIIALEHSVKEPVIKSVDHCLLDWHILKVKKYGKIQLTIIQKRSETS